MSNANNTKPTARRGRPPLTPQQRAARASQVPTAITALQGDATEPLLTWQPLSRALRALGHRSFSYRRFCVLVADGAIPGYDDHLHLYRGRPVRRYRLSEVLSALLRAMRRTA